MSGRHTDINIHVGKTYNYLTVNNLDIQFKQKSNKLQKVTYFNCTCICGNTKTISAGNILSNSIKSCGCKKKEIILKAINDNYIKNFKTLVEKRSFSGYKRHGKEFSLSFEQFSKLVNSNCHYCNNPPNNLLGNKTKSITKLLHGVDRLDSKIEYIIENCVSCCKQCNIMKMTWSKSEFLNQVKKIYEFNKL